ncbi:MAG TPA: arylesterase [Stellaceae bacterium]|nr:arylesterase [Stellaceae bacterium]
MEGDDAVSRWLGHRIDRACLALTLLIGVGTAAPAMARVPEILAFGDSLTAGYGLPQSQSFPAQLQAALAKEGIEARVVDAGVSGDTTGDGLARLDWALAQKPDLVILELGANDMLRGIDPKIVRTNLEAMLKKIKASGAKVLLAGMLSVPNWGPGYRQEFDRLYPELAKEYGVMLYPFFLKGVAMDPALNQLDGKHPNARGVAAIVDGIVPDVARLIGGEKS